jgi:hypothetical protein
MKFGNGLQSLYSEWPDMASTRKKAKQVAYVCSEGLSRTELINFEWPNLTGDSSYPAG